MPRHPVAPVTQGVFFALDDQTPAPRTPDGRPVFVQSTARRTTNFNIRALCFYTAKLQAGNLHNVNPINDDDYGDASLKLYNASGTLITDVGDIGDAVKTVIDWEPHYNYEIIGGKIDIPTSIADGTTDLWYLAAIGVPDYPPEYYGSISYINEINLEASNTKQITADGRAISYLPYQYGGNPGTNKLRFIFKHPAGVQKRFQLLIDHYI